MKVKIKNIARVVILLPLSIYLLYCVYYFGDHKIKPTYLDCGRVVSKSSDEVAIKHGANTDLYLNVQFEKSGFRAIKTKPTTYFSKKVGDSVCFDMEEITTNWHKVTALVGACTLAILGIVGFAALAIYLLPEEW